MEKTPQDRIVEEALSTAKRWQDRANELMTAEEKAIQEQMKRLVQNPNEKVVLVRLIDQSFRSDDYRRVADQVNKLLREYGVPKFFSLPEQGLMRLFLSLGRHVPNISIPKMIEKIRKDSSRSIIPGEEESLYAHLKRRKAEGVRMNINHLGEAVLGEEEAGHRLSAYLTDLADPNIEYISVKISTIFSQINPLDFEATVDVIVRRLSRLYREAAKHTYTKKDGTQAPKFVNLDMEEHRDLEITTAAFLRVLNQPEFHTHSAGIVFQAYIPESFAMQQELTEWAKQRVETGGAPVKIRIVKGANMEMEQLESVLYNWPLPSYDDKADTDANFKRMIRYGLMPENAKAAHIGVGSHNLFDLAYAYRLARENDVVEAFSFEMLEGMANHIRRAIQETGEEMVLYAPVAGRDQFINAIAYLIRRLDENTAEENFLRHSFHLTTDSGAWALLKRGFLESLERVETVSGNPRRTQDRRTETHVSKVDPRLKNTFENEPDTDWSLAANRAWAEGIRKKWKKSPQDPPEKISPAVAGKDIFEGKKTISITDSSQAAEEGGVTAAVCALADVSDLAAAVETARADPDGWRTTPFETRWEILSRAACNLRKARADLIGVSAATAGKVFFESDPEVSEAIDFCEYYPYSAAAYYARKNLECRPKGVGVVISPWNFPIAIPTGGMTAALCTGNTVIFKPASAAIPTARILCECLWSAGVSKNTLQFLPAAGAEAGDALIGHPDVDFIIFTGGTETGMHIIKKCPGVYLAAETGGKNATIVTAMSDREQAIGHVIHSAFSHCGQKCSATSLLILEREVYEDELFRRQLKDAAESLAAGSVWDFKSRMGPLIKPPAGDLKRALTVLEPGESWLLEPRPAENNPYLWTPGIKWGVRPGGYTHQTEFFGPLLAVMCAEDLEEAIRLANDTPYGLTSGLESLDRREQERWKAQIVAGNLYINRGTTGAVVLRQPFGGMKKSNLGAGIKAGSPNYVTQFMNITETGYPETGAIMEDHTLLRLARDWRLKLDWDLFSDHTDDLEKTHRAICSYLYWMETEFSRETDYFHLRGQDNLLRYQPVGKVMIRIHPADSLFEVLARIAAARITGCPFEISHPPGLKTPVTAFLTGHEGRRFTDNTLPMHQSEKDVAERIPKLRRIRYAAPDRVSPEVLSAAARTGFYVSRTPVLMEGRVELLQYLREQAVSVEYHRYGNLGERAVLD